MGRTSWMLEHYLVKLREVNADRQRDLTLEMESLTRENESLREQLRAPPVSPLFRRHRHTARG